MAEPIDGRNGQIAAPSEERLRLRPGANVFGISPDELQIAFPNYTVSFTSPQVVRVVTAAVDVLRTGALRATVVDAAVAATGSDAPFVDYIVTLLSNSRCVYVEGDSPGSGSLDQFHAYLGDDPGRVRSVLASRPVTVLATHPADDMRAEADRAGLNVTVVPLRAGATCGSVLARARDAINAGTWMLACWNVPYRVPLARMVNELAIEHRRGALFGACEGVVGRIGPYVLPGNSACLECANLRLLSNAGAPELRAQLEYRAKYDDVVPDPWPSHPVFEKAVAGLFLLELAQIVTDQPPQTLGGFVEHVFPAGMAQRHPIHRVPGCPSCHPMKPRRLAWDVRFPAPAMRSSAE